MSINLDRADMEKLAGMFHIFDRVIIREKDDGKGYELIGRTTMRLPIFGTATVSFYEPENNISVWLAANEEWTIGVQELYNGYYCPASHGDLIRFIMKELRPRVLHAWSEGGPGELDESFFEEDD